MNKKIITVLVMLTIISLTLIYTLASAYAVIINVSEENGIQEIINVITLRDLVTNDDGTYNNTYYNVKNELEITEQEVNLLLESNALNDKLQIVLNSIVDYKLNNNINARLSNEEIYNLIAEGVNNTENLTEELRSKVIRKSNVYKRDISDFLYDIEVSLVGGL